jgi:hypothetical protein
MNFKKALSCVVAAAMGLSVVAAMAVSVGASDFRAPTYDSRTGGFTINDFRRGSAPMLNAVEIDEFYTDFAPNSQVNMTMRLPEGVEYADVKFVRVEFDFPADWDMDDMNNVSVIFQNNHNSWQQHNVHINPDEILACGTSAARVCNNTCKIEMVNDKPVAMIPVNLGPTNTTESGNNEYFIVIVTADWADGDNTPGKARVTLLNEARTTIQMTLHCATCNGNCTCPHAACGKFPCECCVRCDQHPCVCVHPCGECNEINCVCCTVCRKAVCECVCVLCGEADCEGECFEHPPEVTTTAGGTGATGTGATGPGGNPINPPTGVVMAVIPTLLAMGAAVVSMRKRK